MRKKKKGQTESIKDVWDAQSHSKEEKREFYQEQIDKYRASGDMELVSYYVTLYASTKPKVEEKEVTKIPDVVEIPDDIDIGLVQKRKKM